MNKKARIDTYKTVYDYDLVVANRAVTLKDLNELYSTCDGKDLDNTVMDGAAACFMCKRKSDNDIIVLAKHNDYNSKIKHEDKFLYIINSAVHEAVHACLDIYANCAVTMDTENQEPHAYFIAWLAERIIKTFLGR